ncbi:IS66 family transposase [Paenibacillus pinihumi]|uniref:IS66 family transposase n=1 Tax=Paenibacillus pinihumi TaxID=669462 RepID=UPI00048BF698
MDNLETSESGRKSKSKAANLGARMAFHKPAILRFLWEVHLSFDNNQAERDLLSDLPVCAASFPRCSNSIVPFFPPSLTR